MDKSWKPHRQKGKVWKQMEVFLEPHWERIKRGWIKVWNLLVTSHQREGFETSWTKDKSKIGWKSKAGRRDVNFEIYK